MFYKTYIVLVMVTLVAVDETEVQKSEKDLHEAGNIEVQNAEDIPNTGMMDVEKDVEDDHKAEDDQKCEKMDLQKDGKDDLLKNGKNSGNIDQKAKGKDNSEIEKKADFITGYILLAAFSGIVICACCSWFCNNCKCKRRGHDAVTPGCSNPVSIQRMSTLADNDQ